MVDFDPSQVTTVSTHPEVAVEVPPGTIQCDTSPKLVAASFGHLEYTALVPSSYQRESRLISVDLFCAGVKLEVSNLESPMKLEFSSTSPKGQDILADV